MKREQIDSILNEYNLLIDTYDVFTHLITARGMRKNGKLTKKLLVDTCQNYLRFLCGIKDTPFDTCKIFLETRFCQKYQCNKPVELLQDIIDSEFLSFPEGFAEFNSSNIKICDGLGNCASFLNGLHEFKYPEGD